MRPGIGSSVVLAGVTASAKAFFLPSRDAKGVSAMTRSCDVSIVVIGEPCASISPIAETAPALMSTR
jgi:hypothetical protein